LTFAFFAIFGVIIYLALSVAHHAEILAYKYGEPYGTLILTLSAVTVEIIMITIMMLNTHNPLLPRDTIYSAVMLDINGLLGLAAIIGGIKHGEQKYNVDSTNSYISMIIVSLGIAMVLPHFIPKENIGNFETPVARQKNYFSKRFFKWHKSKNRRNIHDRKLSQIRMKINFSVIGVLVILAIRLVKLVVDFRY